MALPKEEIKCRGLPVPPFFSPEWVEDMRNMSLRPDDIWVVSYPKAGTTWTQQIVKLVLNNGEEDGEKITESVPWVEAFNDIPEVQYQNHFDVDKYPSPRAFKSHFPYNLMPCGLPETTPGRFIYVARNPKDVAVSFYYQYRRMPHCLSPEWDQFFERFMKGEVEFGNYFDHVLSWWEHRDKQNVLFMKYEDMKKDLLSAVLKIAKFVGSDIGEDIISKIASCTTFSKMKENSTANYSWNSHRYVPGETDFMRKGIIGDWKSLFTPEQSERIDVLYKEKLLSIGLEFNFGC